MRSDKRPDSQRDESTKSVMPPGGAKGLQPGGTGGLAGEGIRFPGRKGAHRPPAPGYVLSSYGSAGSPVPHAVFALPATLPRGIHLHLQKAPAFLAPLMPGGSWPEGSRSPDQRGAAADLPERQRGKTDGYGELGSDGGLCPLVGELSDPIPAVCFPVSGWCMGQRLCFPEPVARVPEREVGRSSEEISFRSRWGTGSRVTSSRPTGAPDGVLPEFSACHLRRIPVWLPSQRSSGELGERSTA